MDAMEIRKAVEQGKPVDIGALCDCIENLTKALAQADKTIADLTKKIEELSKSNRLDQPYSVSAFERAQALAAAKNGKKPKRSKNSTTKPGRKLNLSKLQAAIRTEQVLPAGLPKDECVLSHTRPVWRLEENKAVIVAYEVWVHKKTKTYGKIPGVIGRGGFGIEFILAVAYQVYTLGLSMDKVVLLTQFFQKLKIGKSQIDAMLNQLAKHLEGEFDTLCSLAANSMILHADETSWSIHSVWALLSEKARIVLHGVHKDGSTLETILDPKTFGGLVNSDDAAVYGRFSKTQKCWAHLLRKAIRICLLAPDEKRYVTLRDGLYDIYRSAKKLKEDRRFSDDGRHNAMIDLQNKLYALIEPECENHFGKSYEGVLEDYRLLLNELLKLNADDALFTFVTTADAVRPNGTKMPASGNNNESERSLRNPAMARDTDRASKTIPGAKRRTIIVSTIESLRCFVKAFTLESITNEFLSWQANGLSCFSRELNKIKDAIRLTGILGKLYPTP